MKLQKAAELAQQEKEKIEAENKKLAAELQQKKREAEVAKEMALKKLQEQ